MKTNRVLGCILTFVVAQLANAGPISALTTFTAGTPARSGEVNANFNAVKAAVDDNDARIKTLLTQMTTLQTDVVALQAQVTTLQTQLTNVIPLNSVVSVTQVAGITTVRFTGANVQVVNGMGATVTSNGSGNILVGYNEARTGGRLECSMGRNPTTFAIVTNETTCIAAGGVWAINHKSGSHYVVVGPEHNYSRSAGVVFGLTNSSNGNYAAVTGGQGNAASAVAASVNGGVGNKAVGDLSAVLGGENNTASEGGATVSGGGGNTASGTNATVGGGQSNKATGNWSAVSGGTNRTAPNLNNWAAGTLLQTN